ncbi:MAG: Lrp/AsnC family transcriptional regulator [Sulfitobacter sp.]
MQIDKTDQLLIELLQNNARMPVVDLARALGLARTTVQARLERLERSGAILGYTIRLGAEARAPIRATALVSIEPRSGPAVLDRLRKLPAVQAVHTTSGRFDLLVVIAAATTQELDQTLDHIGEARGVKGSESLIHLSTKLDRRG